MADGLRAVAALTDPVGEVADGWVRPNGLRVQRVRVPLGVVAIIYQNRPNVTSDAFSLCLKSGHAAFLLGSAGPIHSNVALAAALRAALGQTGLPTDSPALAGHTRHATPANFMHPRAATATVTGSGRARVGP